MPHEFVCLTDSETLHGAYGITVLPLFYNWPGWWSKMELFRLSGPVLYFDLDTLIVGNLDTLVDAAGSLMPCEFAMLRAFRRPIWASGIMMWNGDCSSLIGSFLADVTSGEFMQYCGATSLQTETGSYRGDQDWIQKIIPNHGKNIISIQEQVDGIHSYKNHIVGSELPEDAKIICFHGKPRPHELDVPWIKQHWSEHGRSVCRK
jgi:hypothetical protein